MATKKKTAKKKLATKKASRKKPAVKTRAVGKKTIGAKKVSSSKKQVRRSGQTADRAAFSTEGRGPRSGRQAGDLQGLSSVERADSESVGELIGEGNAF